MIALSLSSSSEVKSDFCIIFTVWAFDFPYYKIIGNELSRSGSLSTGRVMTSILYRIMDKSNFLKLISYNPPKNKPKHIEYTYRIIKESKELFSSRFKGDFHVAIAPSSCDDFETDLLIQKLIQNNISVKKYYHWNYANLTIIGDGHPTGEMNKILAEMIS
jgi:hypothetical protein